MWKKPFRKNNTISQTFGSGMVTVCAVTDGGKPGKRPVEQLNAKVRLAYEEQRMGIQRYYAGRQAQVKVQRVIRCPDCGKISPQDVAITEDGARYRIDMVQMVPGIFPACVDVTLAQIEQKYAEAEVTADGMA